MRALVLGLGALSASDCEEGTGTRDQARPTAVAPRKHTARVHVIGGLGGALSPCGCQPAMRGGLDHAGAAIAASEHASALLLVGTTLVVPDSNNVEAAAQVGLKAMAIAESLAMVGVDAWTPGAHDVQMDREALARAVTAINAKVVLANARLDGVPTRATHVFERGGIRIGVTGVLATSPEVAARPDVHFGPAVPALRKAVDELAHGRAQVRILLASTTVAEAIELVTEVSGFDVVVVAGANAGETFDSDAPGRASGAVRVAVPMPELSALTAIDLEGSADGVHVAPPLHVPITDALGTAKPIAARIARYEAAVRQTNRSVRAIAIPPAADGRRYVGHARCRTCHDAAHVFWNNTAHARAFWTLQSRGRDRDLDCIGCHATGYGQPGGQVGMPSAELLAVQCEACHGPGSAHVEAGDPASIVLAPEQGLCRACHRPPHVSPGWDLSRAWRQTMGRGHGVADRD